MSETQSSAIKLQSGTQVIELRLVNPAQKPMPLELMPVIQGAKGDKGDMGPRGDGPVVVDWETTNW